MSVLTDGELVRFKILECTQKKSKAGNEMLALTLALKSKESGATGEGRDWVMFNNSARLGAFAAAVGLKGGEELDAKTLLGREGLGVVGYEEAKPKDNGGEWPARWRVQRWGRPAEKSEAPAPMRPRHGVQTESPPWVMQWGRVTAHAIKHGLEVPAKDGALIVEELDAGTGWAFVPGAAAVSAMAPMIAQVEALRPAGVGVTSHNYNPTGDEVPF